jgi:hypothetical protein
MVCCKEQHRACSTCYLKLKRRSICAVCSTPLCVNQQDVEIMKRLDGKVQCFDGCGAVLNYKDVCEHKYICPNVERIQCPDCDVISCGVTEFTDHMMSRHDTFIVEKADITWSEGDLITLYQDVQRSKHTIFVLSDVSILHTSNLVEYRLFSDSKIVSCKIHFYTQEDQTDKPVESCLVDKTAIGTCASLPQMIEAYASCHDSNNSTIVKLVFHYAHV